MTGAGKSQSDMGLHILHLLHPSHCHTLLTGRQRCTEMGGCRFRG